MVRFDRQRNYLVIAKGCQLCHVTFWCPFLLRGLGSGEVTQSIIFQPAFITNQTLPKIGFVVGDLIDPARNLPRILHSAQMIVISLFAAMNIALYLILPMDVMRSRYTVVVVRFG